MAKLVVKLHGKEIAALNLESGRDYVVGRNADCDVVLDTGKGISRQHFKLHHSGAVWTAELMSRLGALIFEGESVESVELRNGTVLSVPPYEFFFSEEIHDGEVDVGVDLSAGTSSEVKIERTNPLVPVGAGRLPARQQPDPEPEGNMEATQATASPLIAYLKVFTDSGDVAQVLKLEGNSWVAGRDETCEIQLNDHHVSRKHFELAKTNSGYYLTDLGSANGTNINGIPVEANEPVQIFSGDTITIMSLTLRLEIHDSRFENKLQVIQAAPLAGPGIDPMTEGYPNLPAFYDGMGQYPAVMKVDPKDNPRRVTIHTLKKHKVRIAIGVLALILVFGLMGGDPPKPQGETNNSSNAPTDAPLDKLSPEQKKLVEKAFELAQAHYYSGKYELCSSELKKIHELVPFYKDSKNLETYCTQALDLMMQNAERERLAREQQEIEQQVASIVDECRGKMTDSTTAEALNDCLAPALDLNPEHPGILELRTVIQIREEEKKARSQAQAERVRAIQAGERKYKTAKELYSRGELRKSIQAYEAYLSGNFPDPNGTEDRARREIAMARKELNQKITTKLNECKKLHGENKYRDAVRACDTAINEDPNHEEARDFRRRVLADLRREMKELFQDGILEENMGNVEAAKDKWKRILREDVPNEEFHQKARQKLRKYGGGE